MHHKYAIVSALFVVGVFSSTCIQVLGNAIWFSL